MSVSHFLTPIALFTLTIPYFLAATECCTRSSLVSFDSNSIFWRNILASKLLPTLLTVSLPQQVDHLWIQVVIFSIFSLRGIAIDHRDWCGSICCADVPSLATLESNNSPDAQDFILYQVICGEGRLIARLSVANFSSCAAKPLARCLFFKLSRI